MNVSQTQRTDPAGFFIAGLLLALAALIFWDTTKLEISPVYGVGPKAMPFVVAGCLAVLAIGNLLMGMRGELPARESVDPKAIVLILGSLSALIAIIGLGGGFIVATAVLFAGTSAAFGRREVLADFAIGIALGVVVYLMFDKLLTLSLPAGPIEHLIDWLWERLQILGAIIMRNLLSIP